MRIQSPWLYDTSGLIKPSRRQTSSTGDVRQFFYRAAIRFKKLKPAYLAFFIASISAVLALFVFNLLLSTSFSVLAFVFVQAILSTVLAVIIGLDRWWRVILFTFPLAAWFLHGFNVPSWIYLLGFILSLSLFWTTFRTQVPFYPSRLKVWRQVESIVDRNQRINMVDIGSGLGDLSMYLSKHRPNGAFTGIEIAPLPWLISVVRSWLKKSNAKFTLGDYNKLDFAKYDIVFAYLSPAAMPDLWKKAVIEMESGSLLLSYEFDIPNVKPSRILQLDSQTPPIYVWEF